MTVFNGVVGGGPVGVVGAPAADASADASEEGGSMDGSGTGEKSDGGPVGLITDATFNGVADATIITGLMIRPDAE